MLVVKRVMCGKRMMRRAARQSGGMLRPRVPNRRSRRAAVLSRFLHRRQPEEAATRFSYPRLKLGIGVLPQFDECPIMSGCLVRVALGLVQLAESLVDAGEHGRIQPSLANRRRRDVPLPVR